MKLNQLALAFFTFAFANQSMHRCNAQQTARRHGDETADVEGSNSMNLRRGDAAEQTEDFHNKNVSIATHIYLIVTIRHCFFRI